MTWTCLLTTPFCSIPFLGHFSQTDEPHFKELGIYLKKKKTALYAKFTLGNPWPRVPRIRAGVLGGQGWLAAEERGVKEKQGLHPGDKNRTLEA